VETSKLAVTVITAALVVAIVSSCGGSDSQVAELLRQSNSHLKKAAEYLEQVAELGRKQEELQKVQAGEESLKETLIGARKAAKASLGEVEKAATALGSAGKRTSSVSMRTYIEMKVDAVEEQKKSLETGVQALDLRIELADDTISGAQSSESVVKALKRISELDEETKRHADRTAELHKRADNFHENKNSGN